MKKYVCVLALFLMCASAHAEDPVRKAQVVSTVEFMTIATSGTSNMDTFINPASGTTIYDVAAFQVQAIGSDIYFTVDGTTTPTVGGGFLLEENSYYLMSPFEAKNWKACTDGVAGVTVPVVRYNIWPAR